jgi:formylglycine-generating enzyme required for sulfatase activity
MFARYALYVVSAAILCLVLLGIPGAFATLAAPPASTPPPTPVLVFPTPTPTQTPTPTSTPIPTPVPTTMSVSPPATWQRPTDGMVMVYVPEGEFLMGSTDAQVEEAVQMCKGCPQEYFEAEMPRHTVALDAFWIDQTEVTNAQYRKCLDAGVCRKPVYWDNSDFSAPDQPVVGVTWNDARTYCEWAGGRLPTEAEWEKAARGTDGRTYPWGNEPATCERVSYGGCVGKASPVGSYPTGASPYGALDMAGNVWEWVADWYAEHYYSRSPDHNPQGPDSGGVRGLRGGSWATTITACALPSASGTVPMTGTTSSGFGVLRSRLLSKVLAAGF